MAIQAHLRDSETANATTETAVATPATSANHRRATPDSQPKEEATAGSLRETPLVQPAPLRCNQGFRCKVGVPL